MHQPAPRARVATILGVTALYLAASAIFARASGNGGFVFYIAVMGVIIGGVTVLHQRVGLSAGVLTGLSA